jgi:hypothetical protein
MVVKIGETGAEPRSRRERALAQRIDRLRAGHANAEYEKAALRLRLVEAAEELWAAVDAVQQRAEAEGEAAWEARDSARVRAEHATLLAALATAEAELDRALRAADDAEYRAGRAEQRASAATLAATAATERAERAEQDLAEALTRIEHASATAIRQSWGQPAMLVSRLPDQPPDFPVSEPGYARAQVRILVNWMYGPRAGTPPTAKFSMVNQGFDPVAVIAWVRDHVGVLRTPQRNKVLNDLPRD